jgi:membrane protease YdiL (CAAX protease family)
MAGRLLAPRWHTLGLIGILLLAVAFGAWFQQRPESQSAGEAERRSVIGLYISALLLDWALFYYVWRFATRYGTTFERIAGERWSGAGDVARDVAIAIPFWVVWQAAAILTHRFLGPSAAKSIGAFLPRSGSEITLWIGVSATAGFCEEFVFRGYLQQQLQAWTGRPGVALAVQSVCFGIAHAYQGIQNAAVITVLGALYGGLALWRRSTRPGMLAHAWSDVYGGLRMQFLSRLLPF